MLHRGIRFVYVALLAFSAVLAFLFVRGLDEQGVLGNSAMVEVFDSDGSSSAPQVVRAVESFSAEHGVGVAREVPDLKNPDKVRDLYLAPGGARSLTSKWLHKGYPSFSGDFSTRVHPISEISQLDPRGTYYVFGSSAAADALSARLTGLGMTVSVSHPLAVRQLIDQYKDDSLFRSFYVIALAALTTAGASVLLNARTYGVLRLQGMSFPRILLRDLRRLAVFWPVSASIVVAAVLTFLGLYNGFAWLGLFAAVAAIAAVLLTGVALTAHAAALALTFKVGLLPSLKGELPSRAASVSVYLVRIPALLLALSIASSVTLAGRDVLTREDNRAAYHAVGGAVSIRLSGAFAMHMDQLNSHVGPWLRSADARGEVIVAGRRDRQISVPGDHLPSGDILIANDTYLAKQAVLDPAGRRYASEARSRTAPDSRAVRLLIPDSLASHAPAIAKAATEILDPRLSRHIPLKISVSRTGQRLFGYNTGAYSYSSGHNSSEDRSMMRDPVIIVVPNGSHFLTNDAYTAFATQAGVVFPDSDDVLNGIRTEHLQNYLNSVSPVGEKTAVDLRKAITELRIQIFNLVVAAMVLLIAAIGVCLIYARKNAQSIFAQHVSGWRYVASHHFILVVELAIAAVFATRVPFQSWQQRQQLRKLAAAGDPATFEPTHLSILDLGVITGLVVFELAAVLLALAYFHRRIVKEGAIGM